MIIIGKQKKPLHEDNDQQLETLKKKAGRDSKGQEHHQRSTPSTHAPIQQNSLRNMPSNQPRTGRKGTQHEGAKCESCRSTARREKHPSETNKPTWKQGSSPKPRLSTHPHRTQSIQSRMIGKCSPWHKDRVLQVTRSLRTTFSSRVEHGVTSLATPPKPRHPPARAERCPTDAPRRVRRGPTFRVPVGTPPATCNRGHGGQMHPSTRSSKAVKPGTP